ncbi:expressed unknown protein [Seminavis robusta]|uniref:C3H1-type domain-containing protein n=1 Tax=Seminavis robusta TaxID=568900 RepID=A0A9N8H611_9STRA|nr:expressed unknown protein [Seminavis robusta]|eukprot:Sro157_g071360.1 n/a (440) ;mRNA; f:91074-92497
MSNSADPPQGGSANETKLSVSALTLSDFEKLGKRMGEAMSAALNMPTAEEKERAEFMGDVKTSWSLFFARVSTQPESGTTKVIPALMTKQFNEVLSAWTPGYAQKKLIAVLEAQLCRSEESNDYRDRSAWWDSKVANGAFTTCSAGFKDLQEEQCGLPSVLVSGEQYTPSTKLVVSSGTLATFEDVRVALLNFRQLGLAFTSQFDESYIWTLFARIEKLLGSREGRQYVHSWSPSSRPQVAVNLLLNLQAVWNKIADIAKNPLRIKAVQENQEIDAEVFDSAKLCFEMVEQELHSIFNFCRTHYIPERYREIPAGAIKVLGMSAEEFNLTAKRGLVDDDDGRAAKKLKADDRKKALGILEYILTPLPAEPMSLMPISGQSGELVPCSHFCFRGFRCSNNKACTRAHVSSFKSLSEDDQNAFLRFVYQNKETIRFAPGSS